MNDRSKPIRVGINGFGQIGRAVFRQLLDKPEFRVDQQGIPFFASPDPEKIPWKETGADIIIECNGALHSRSKAAGHRQVLET